MNPQFLLPCPYCPQSLTVEARQAGQQLLCPSCGKTLDAPKLRDLKRLKPINQPHESAADTRPNPFKAGMFAAGLVLFLLGAIAGWALLRAAAPMLAQDDFEKRIEMFGQTFEDASPAAVWRFMELILADHELPPFEQAEWRTEFQLGQLFRNVAYGLWAVSAIGLVLAATSMVLLSRDQARRTRKI